MKRLILLPMLAACLNSFAGWEMVFCSAVDEKEECVGKAETFTMSGTAIEFSVLLSNAEGLNTAKVYFEVYKIDPATFTEDLVATQEISTAANAKGTSQVLKLTQKGNYLIKARNAYKDYITSRELVIQ